MLFRLKVILYMEAVVEQMEASKDIIQADNHTEADGG